MRVHYIYEVPTYMYEVFKILHALKLNLSNYQNSKLCKNKRKIKPGGNPARQNVHHKFTTFPTNSYFSSDQFIFPTKSYFRPIPISDQFLFQTNFYFRPIPISDQFLFPTNSYSRPIPISDHADCEVGTFSRKHGKRTAACGNYK